jgi:hypothetical protein
MHGLSCALRFRARICALENREDDRGTSSVSEAIALRKTAHILSAAILFGTGLGTAFFCWFGYRNALRANEIAAYRNRGCMLYRPGSDIPGGERGRTDDIAWLATHKFLVNRGLEPVRAHRSLLAAGGCCSVTTEARIRAGLVDRGAIEGISQAVPHLVRARDSRVRRSGCNFLCGGCKAVVDCPVLNVARSARVDCGIKIGAVSLR